jgi:hypothetical protein
LVPAWQRRAAAVTGGVLLFALVLVLELLQQFIPGRTSDLTTPFVYALAWIGAWSLLRADTGVAGGVARTPVRAYGRR